ncbi:MAG: hypothetical protein MRJ96_12145 [Nitrospirales bacterium]|nr:glycosyltransferase [Nitrospira sp.]MDR4502192.1 hypothetical protein [Nitrospirales bacterium]
MSSVASTSPHVLAWPAFRKERANPHAALLARALREKGVVIDDWTPVRAFMRKVDIWHLHHPDTVVYPRHTFVSFCGVVTFAGLLCLARFRRTRIIWTIHDFTNNDGLHPWLESWFWQFFLPRLDACICLTEGGIVRARERFPQLRELPVYAVPHGHFLDAYPNTISREQARDTLNIPQDATVLLHFGLMRPYKNVPHLIDTFNACDQRNSLLLIVGKPYDHHVEREINQCVGTGSRIRLRLGWIPPEEVQLYFVACDLVVLPYKHIVNSGALMLALSFSRPVLVPNLGNMREQQQAFGERWIRVYEGALTPVTLAEACDWAVSTERPTQNLTGFGWETIAERTLEVYRRVLGHPDPPHPVLVQQ